MVSVDHEKWQWWRSAYTQQNSTFSNQTALDCNRTSVPYLCVSFFRDRQHNTWALRSTNKKIVDIPLYLTAFQQQLVISLAVGCLVSASIYSTTTTRMVDDNLFGWSPTTPCQQSSQSPLAGDSHRVDCVCAITTQTGGPSRCCPGKRASCHRVRIGFQLQLDCWMIWQSQLVRYHNVEHNSLVRQSLSWIGLKSWTVFFDWDGLCTRGRTLSALAFHQQQK